MLYNKPLIDSHRDLVDYEMHNLLKGELVLQKHLPVWLQTAVAPGLKTLLTDYLELVRSQINALSDFLDKEYIILRSAPDVLMRAFVTDTDVKLSYCTAARQKDAGLLLGILSICQYQTACCNNITILAGAAGMEKQQVAMKQMAQNNGKMAAALLQADNLLTTPG